MIKVPTILVAEDEENDFLLIQRAFSQLEQKAFLTRARDGVEAISYLEGDEDFGDRLRFPLPDLVILDLKMPCKDGFEVLQWIRQHPQFKTTITIILSSSDQPNDISRAYALGANSYLTKPANYTDLVELVRVLSSFWIQWTCRPAVNSPDTHFWNQRIRV